MNVTSPPAARRVAGALMILAAACYWAAELVTIHAWTLPIYRWTVNKVPDLSSPFCGSFQGRSLCSPLHNVMNAGFVLEGMLLGAATFIISRLLVGRARVTLAVLAATHATGLSLVVAFPQTPQAFANGSVIVHFVGDGLAILAGNLIALYASRMHKQLTFPFWLTRISFLLGAVGLLSALLSLVIHSVPAPIWERASIYPFVLWELVFGIVTVVRPHAWLSSDRSR